MAVSSAFPFEVSDMCTNGRNGTKRDVEMRGEITKRPRVIHPKWWAKGKTRVQSAHEALGSSGA